MHLPKIELSPRYKWYVVGMLWWISFFNYADRQALSAVSKVIAGEMDLDRKEVGAILAAFAWVYGLCAPLAGVIVDRVRRKTAILGGLHAWSVICMATALARSKEQLMFFRGAEGLGETFYYPASMSMISDYHGTETRSRAMGIHQTSVYLGTIAGSVFAGLIGQYYGWRWSFVFFGFLGIVLGLGLQRFLHEPTRSSQVEAASSKTEGRIAFAEALKVVCRTPTVFLLLLAFLCANFVAMVLLSWMPTYLGETFDLNLAMAGLTATLYVQLASMVGSPLGGWLADGLRQRLPGGRILIQMLGVLGGVPFVFVCGQTRSLGVIIIALTAWGLFKGIYDANIFASAFDVVPAEARGTVAGFMNMVGWLCGAAPAPIVIGYLAEVYGLGPAISSAAIVYVLAAFFLLLAALLFVRRDLMHEAQSRA